MNLQALAAAVLCVAAACAVYAQAPPQGKGTPTPASPADLPGKGLAEHDFLYAGEAKDRRVFIVKKGEVVWIYEDPTGKGEISDAVLMSNGNVVIAHQYAVKVISPEKKVIWNHDAPKGCEIHTAVPIGKEHILFIQNGEKPFLRVVNIVNDKTVREFPLPVKNPKDVHVQFRHARLTAQGTVLVAHKDLDKVVEYDETGKELWSVPVPGLVWGVSQLKSGNILISGKGGVHEVNRKGESVWTWERNDSPAYQMPNLQMAWRLSNGNTLINNWVNEWSAPLDRSNLPVQAIEVTPDKKVVWALRSWHAPDLGPATTIQILDDPYVAAPEDVHFGSIK